MLAYPTFNWMVPASSPLLLHFPSQYAIFFLKCNLYVTENLVGVITPLSEFGTFIKKVLLCLSIRQRSVDIFTCLPEYLTLYVVIEKLHILFYYFRVRIVKTIITLWQNLANDHQFLS